MIISGNTITVNGTEVIKENGSISATNGFFTNPVTVTANYTIPVGENAMSAGSITVVDGVPYGYNDSYKHEWYQNVQNHNSV